MAALDPRKSNVIPFSFYHANVITAAAAEALAAVGEATAGDVPQQPVPWAFSVVGISVQIEAARTCGTCAVQPAINGSAVAAAITIDGTNTQYMYNSWVRGAYAGTAGQRVGCLMTTSTTWAAGTTPSLRATVFVHAEE